jgi:Protein of unknown function (DUF3995)
MESVLSRNRAQTRASGVAAAWAAFAVGLLYAAVSLYWALGGGWLLDTVGASLTQASRSASALVVIAVWFAVGLKVIASVLPLPAAAAITPGSLRWRRLLRALSWIEAAILTVYGLIWTAAGLLVQAGVIGTPASADHRALAWHAYLWDPWFLVWGVLVTAALLRSR